MIRKNRRRKIAPQDLFKLRVITGIAMSPDEKRVAYGIERMDASANKYFKNIHVLEIATGHHSNSPTAITVTASRSGHPMASSSPLSPLGRRRPEFT